MEVRGLSPIRGGAFDPTERRVPLIVLPAQAAPERRWLAHLVRVGAGALRAGDLFDDAFPFDDQRIVQLAMRHRVAPLLHTALERGDIADAVPGSFRDLCREAYFATLRKNVVALEIGEVALASLRAAGIPVAPVKGFHLLGPDGVYEDPGVRPMDDLDLMVARSDIDAAGEVLSSLGFSLVTGRRQARLAAGHELAYHRPIGRVNLFIELHWAWAGPESLMRAHAIANGVFVGATNRVGVEDGIEFWGASFVANPTGSVLQRASLELEETLI